MFVYKESIYKHSRNARPQVETLVHDQSCRFKTQAALILPSWEHWKCTCDCHKDFEWVSSTMININLLTERVWSALSHIHSFHAALRHHGSFLSLLACTGSLIRNLSDWLVSPDIDAAMTTSTNSPLWRSASTLFRTHFIKDCRVFFYLPRSHNNNCGVPHVLTKQTKKEEEKTEKKIHGHTKQY